MAYPNSTLLPYGSQVYNSQAEVVCKMAHYAALRERNAALSELAEARNVLEQIYTLCNEGRLDGELEEPDDVAVIEWIERAALNAISEEARAKPDDALASGEVERDIESPVSGADQ